MKLNQNLQKVLKAVGIVFLFFIAKLVEFSFFFWETISHYLLFSLLSLSSLWGASNYDKEIYIFAFQESLLYIPHWAIFVFVIFIFLAVTISIAHITRSKKLTKAYCLLSPLTEISFLLYETSRCKDGLFIGLCAYLLIFGLIIIVAAFLIRLISLFISSKILKII